MTAGTALIWYISQEGDKEEKKDTGLVSAVEVRKTQSDKLT